MGGMTFFLALALAFRLRSLFLNLSSPISINNESLIWAGRLLFVGAVITPLLHMALHRLSALRLPPVDRRSYGRMLLAPLALDLLALPLLAVEAVSPDATILIAVNTALLTGDLLIYFWLRRFPAAARVVETKEQIMVYS
ncbi:MAG: hypothetical protein KatS3mg057_3219 [Herpetosiphonaceae bacterium]|nr:MAG: hypothetical protein KatS3mg057_3219 [Herpetosiphonaceae bacterium]